ncbi:MAG TPA: hypothetical protein VJV78_18505 [Polyangiales bacterium]|nr:hypothetical protein [Polyangiales bacterium]
MQEIPADLEPLERLALQAVSGNSKWVWALSGALFVAVAGGAAVWALGALKLRLAIGHAVDVDLRDSFPVRASVTQPLAVTIDEQLVANVRLTELSIPIDETLEVPLHMNV